MGADDVGFDSLQRLKIQTQLRWLTAAQVVPNHVGGLHQLMEQCATFDALKIKGNAAFGQVKRLKVGAVIVRQSDRS